MKLNIAVALYTFNRIDDVKINLEIIRDIWEKSGLFKKTYIVHSFNGKNNWYPQKYLEDKLIRIPNRGHFWGAADLIESGINFFNETNHSADYIVTLAADTWLLNPDYIHKIIKQMKSENKYVASSTWGNPFETDPIRMGMSTDFFIVNQKWSQKYNLFPLNYDEFYKKYFEVLMFQKKVVYLERIFSLRFFQSVQKYYGKKYADHTLTRKKDELLYRIKEREPVHNYFKDRVYRPQAPFQTKVKRFFNTDFRQYRNMYWPTIELLTHHDPVTKQKHLQNHNYPQMKYTKKFVEAKNLNYFNNPKDLIYNS